MTYVTPGIDQRQHAPWTAARQRAGPQATLRRGARVAKGERKQYPQPVPHDSHRDEQAQTAKQIFHAHDSRSLPSRQRPPADGHCQYVVRAGARVTNFPSRDPQKDVERLRGR